MIFNTSWFLLFFPAVFALLLAVPGPRVRFHVLLAASAVFHFHFAGPAGVLPIAVMALATYAAGLAIARREGPARRRLFVFALSVPVGGLVAYKYQALLAHTLGGFLAGEAGAALLSRPAPALPLAISFFAFEFIHYLTDVERGGAPIRDPFRFALFSIHFPSIVSGPIKRYGPFLAQVAEGLPRPRLDQVVSGFGQALIGFFKKLVVADAAATAVALLDARGVGDRRSVVVLIALLSVRIVFDFSGYSDIAIGLSRMIGIELPPNFRAPYAARDIAEFWQRWHMSLSTWIRDYVYIPLGGSRSGLPRRLVNLALTMFLCGLWHGPAWHFGLWGLYHGAGLGLHALWERTALAARLRPIRALAPVAVGLNVAFVAWGWLLFFYDVPDVRRLTRVLFLGS